MSTPAAEAYTKAQQPVWTPPAQIGRVLTHADRCDQCGAAAYVRTEAYETTFSLLWCAHHFTEHEGNGHFPATLYEILDERPHLKAAVHAQANRKEIH
jgi:hypothetical protein